MSSSSHMVMPMSSSTSSTSPTTSPSSYSAAPGRLLAGPKDAEWLSPHLCILRSIIEAFAATRHDVEARRKLGGMKHPPQVGQVAIRCVHCKHLPLRQRYKGSEAYPSSVSKGAGRAPLNSLILAGSFISFPSNFRHDMCAFRAYMYVFNRKNHWVIFM